MATIKGVFFDFDGTLTELTLDFPSLKAEILNIARKYASNETVTSLEGHYIIEIIYAIADGLLENGSDFSQEAFERLRILELEASLGKNVYPYTRDVLRHLKEKGIKTGIITRSCIDVVKSVFPDVDEYIDATITREHIREVKPHPDHVRAIARLLSILPEEAIMVGDHPTDIIAGKGAGMKTVGLLAGRSTREDFEKAGAAYIIEDIRGILTLVQ